MITSLFFLLLFSCTFTACQRTLCPALVFPLMKCILSVWLRQRVYAISLSCFVSLCFLELQIDRIKRLQRYIQRHCIPFLFDCIHCTHKARIYLVLFWSGGGLVVYIFTSIILLQDVFTLRNSQLCTCDLWTFLYLCPASKNNLYLKWEKMKVTVISNKYPCNIY